MPFPDYVISTELTSGVNIERLDLEFRAEAGITGFGGLVVSVADDSCSVLGIDPGEATAADVLIATHDGAACPELDPEYMEETYVGNRLVSRFIYSDSALTIPYESREFEYISNRVWRETMKRYGPAGYVAETMTWEYTTTIQANGRKTRKARVEEI